MRPQTPPPPPPDKKCYSRAVVLRALGINNIRPEAHLLARWLYRQSSNPSAVARCVVTKASYLGKVASLETEPYNHYLNI